MKLTVDCVLTSQLSALPYDSALACLLSKSSRTWLDSPLEAVVCDQHGLKRVSDYPIAVIAASAEGIGVGDAYWLRADPVHLILQRDSFSLGEPVPLQIAHEQSEGLLSSLNEHFKPDGLRFVVGNSGAWYLRPAHAPQIKTTLPSVAADKDIFQFMPQGEEGAKWGAYLNEVQMVLHAHPVNIARESAGLVAVNSVWFSGGGVMPQKITLKQNVDLIAANSAFYRGLAQWSGLPSVPVGMDLETVLQNAAPYPHVRLQLTPERLLSDACFQVLLNALNTDRIKELTINLGCYERTLTLTITRLHTFKFWRKLKPVMHFVM